MTTMVPAKGHEDVHKLLASDGSLALMAPSLSSR